MGPKFSPAAHPHRAPARKPMSNTRRDFVKTAAGVSLAATMATAAPGSIPKRKLGKTGLDVSILGLGGARAGNLLDHKQAIDTIRRCYDLGVTYFDTAAAGAYGLSQTQYGVALEGVRDKVVLATKTRHRTAAHSELDLNQSLSNMKTDHIDLYQVHNVMHQEDIDFIFGPRGLMEMIEKARKAGKIRHVGVTGHMDPRVLKKIIGMYDFATILMPLSITDGANSEMSFERTVLPLAIEKGMGVIAMKATGVGQLMTQNVAPLADCLNYVWSLPVATAILGCTTTQQVESDAKLAAAHTSPLSNTQMDEMRAKYAAVDFAKLEPWKVDQSATLAHRSRYQGD